ncbi:hypothetical protein [Paenibacillus thiaminolyticus]|uniref:Uncharacterized protein n=1 Tax=Paenibacillus thiaminolyticus TaxID=49283 RepID=A0AAP9DUJ2_PANTH|nr:hypothetical protein [Paenibacillus thiaminolyticus]MCY9613469.1 hypothetical protein [Paenibacillus thiaminolyticus]MCY9639977.1 hypothetical protein [Paenibacillus thiaminolyticus]QDM42811.1 hypothetical protein FLT43_04350 [Paenibacillus thiaminolyticus]CAH8713646.1 hypothetical protein KYE0_003317 [Paenibacillus thiaminolyticus]SUA98282.1 Uncharacterised protein [Paenibacillus thiaminolyticus]
MMLPGSAAASPLNSLPKGELSSPASKVWQANISVKQEEFICLSEISLEEDRRSFDVMSS